MLPIKVKSIRCYGAGISRPDGSCDVSGGAYFEIDGFKSAEDVELFIKVALESHIELVGMVKELRSLLDAQARLQVRRSNELINMTSAFMLTSHKLIERIENAAAQNRSVS